MSNWYYESDGEIGARTHYAVRDNAAFPCGIERRDFRTAAEAREFIAANQPSDHLVLGQCPRCFAINRHEDNCPTRLPVCARCKSPDHHVSDCPEGT